MFINSPILSCICEKRMYNPKKIYSCMQRMFLHMQLFYTLLSLLLLAVTFCLFRDQFLILKIVDLHCALYICKSLCGNCFCSPAAFFQNTIYLRDILLPFFSALTDRFQFFLQNIVQEFLHL